MLHPRLGLLALLILGALGAFGPLASDLYLPALPAIGREFAAPAALVQASLGSCILGLALGQLVVGPLSDAWGRRRPLLVGLLVFGITSLLCAFAPDAPTLVAARFVQGLAGSAGIVLSLAMVRDVYEGPALAKVLSRLLLVSGVAPIAAPLLGSGLLAVGSWRSLFWVLAGVGFFLWLASWWALPETKPAPRLRSGTPWNSFAAEAGRPGFAGFVLTGGLAIAAGATYISAAPFVLQDLLHVPATLFGLIFGVNAAGLVAAGQIGARYVVQVGPRALLGIGLAVLAAAGVHLVAAALLGGGLAWIWPGLFALTAALGLILPNSAALAMERAASAGTAAALLGVIQFGIAGLASPLAGVFGVASPLPMAGLILFFSAAASAVHILSRPKPRAAGPTAAPLPAESPLSSRSETE